MEFIIAKRDIVVDDDDYYDDSDGSWWYGPKAAIIKWSIVGVIFLIALLWLFGGYIHAQRRMKKGLQPLAYHRWLLRRSQRNQFLSQNQVSYNQQQNRYDEGYQMQGYPAPPPAYNPSLAPPPKYQPPTEFSKGDSNQDWVVPPPGPPPLSESSSAGQQASLTQAREAQETTPATSAKRFPDPSFQPHKQSLMERFNPFRPK